MDITNTIENEPLRLSSAACRQLEDALDDALANPEPPAALVDLITSTCQAS